MSANEDLIKQITAEYFNSVHEQLGPISKEKNRYVRHINTDSPELKRKAADMLASGEAEFEFDYPLSEEEKSMYTASMIFWLLGMDAMADKMSSAVIKSIVMRVNTGEYVKKITSIATKAHLKKIASKPRNKHHDEAVRIMRNTWEAYPHVSCNKMKQAIINHFKGKVGNDALGEWIKTYSLKPDRKPENKPFCLVL